MVAVQRITGEYEITGVGFETFGCYEEALAFALNRAFNGDWNEIYDSYRLGRVFRVKGKLLRLNTRDSWVDEFVYAFYLGEI